MTLALEPGMDRCANCLVPFKVEEGAGLAFARYCSRECRDCDLGQASPRWGQPAIESPSPFAKPRR